MVDIDLKITSILNKNVSDYFVASTHKDRSYP